MKLLHNIKRGVRLLKSEQELWGFQGSESAGIFAFLMNGEEVHVIASTDGGWDHVSVGFQNRCPTWSEMETIKRTFFLPHETAMQLHVPPHDHINCNPNVLHMWRPTDREIPRPPAEMV